MKGFIIYVGTIFIVQIISAYFLWEYRAFGYYFSFWNIQFLFIYCDDSIVIEEEERT